MWDKLIGDLTTCGKLLRKQAGTSRNWGDQCEPRVVEQDKKGEHSIIMFCSLINFSIDI
jgi:hypothetical protein